MNSTARRCANCLKLFVLLGRARDDRRTRLRVVEWQPTPSNNGMHPTANSAALIENLDGFKVECAAGDAGR